MQINKKVKYKITYGNSMLLVFGHLKQYINMRKDFRLTKFFFTFSNVSFISEYCLNWNFLGVLG